MYTVAQLETLKRNYAKGVFRVREADLTLDFASGDDMARRIQAIENELVDAGLIKVARRPKVRTARGVFCR